ncbi:hypothetical protein [Labedella populi]|nr:hypothetical protein [Labedella populi]
MKKRVTRLPTTAELRRVHATSQPSLEQFDRTARSCAALGLRYSV